MKKVAHTGGNAPTLVAFHVGPLSPPLQLTLLDMPGSRRSVLPLLKRCRQCTADTTAQQHGQSLAKVGAPPNLRCPPSESVRHLTMSTPAHQQPRAAVPRQDCSARLLSPDPQCRRGATVELVRSPVATTFDAVAGTTIEGLARTPRELQLTAHRARTNSRRSERTARRSRYLDTLALNDSSTAIL